MTSRTRLKRPTALGLIVLATVGCSGPSKEAFLQEAGAICVGHRATIDAAASQVLAGGQLPSPEAFGRLAQETIIPELTAQFSELRKLQPPTELADVYGQYLSLGEATVEEMRTDPSILTDATNFAEVNRQADAAGLSEACRVGPG